MYSYIKFLYAHNECSYIVCWKLENQKIHKHKWAKASFQNFRCDRSRAQMYDCGPLFGLWFVHLILTFTTSSAILFWPTINFYKWRCPLLHEEIGIILAVWQSLYLSCRYRVRGVLVWCLKNNLDHCSEAPTYKNDQYYLRLSVSVYTWELGRHVTVYVCT